MQNTNRDTIKRKKILIRAAAILLPMVVTLLLLSQTAFARNTYVITDGSRVLVHTSAATDPREILDEAGLELGDGDTYTTQAGTGVSEITIRRSQTILVNCRGEEFTAEAYGETVGELLERLGIVLTEGDTVSYEKDALTFDGMVLTVSNVRRQVEHYTVTVPHDVTYCDDGTLPLGEEQVLTKGVDGLALCQAEVTYVNGVETGRQILSQRVTHQPVAEIIGVGTGENLPQEEIADPDAPIIRDGTIILPTGEVLTYTDTLQVSATGYSCDGYGITYCGTVARVGAIAVDPRVIPYGTRMYIVSNDGEYVYGIASAEDCGGGIKGHKVDLYFNTSAECFQFGVRPCTIYILG